MKLSDMIAQSLSNDAELKKEFDNLKLKYELITKLIEYRKKNDLTIKEFAKRVKLKPKHILKFEKGELDPKLSFINQILNELDLDISLKSKSFKLDDSHIPFVSPEEQKELNIDLSNPECREMVESEELNIEI